MGRFWIDGDGRGSYRVCSDNGAEMEELHLY